MVVDVSEGEPWDVVVGEDSRLKSERKDSFLRLRSTTRSCSSVFADFWDSISLTRLTN